METDPQRGAVSDLREPEPQLNTPPHPAPRQPAPEALQLHSQVRFLLIGLTIALVFGSIFSLPPIQGENDASRWSTAWSLSMGQGYVIDQSPYKTCDKVFRAGHYYSSKPPLMPALLGGLVRVISLNNRFPFQWRENIHTRLILLLLNVIPLVFLLFLYDRLMARWRVSSGARLFCLCAAAFGTYVTGYSVTLNNHTQAAWAAFFSLYLLIHILENDALPITALERLREGLAYSACALFASWAAVNENPAIAYLLILMGVLYVMRKRQTLIWFLPVALAMLVAFFYATYKSTGRLYPYSLNYDHDLYVNYPGSVWGHPTGIDAQHEPKWWYAFNLILGHHGLLSLTPIFIFSVWGLLRKKHAFGDAHLLINRMGLALLVSITLLYIFATHNYGGGCQGPRWLIWLTPFLLLALPSVVERHFHARTFRFFAYAALFVSMYSIGYALAKGPWGNNNDSWLQWVFRYFQWIQGY